MSNQYVVERVEITMVTRVNLGQVIYCLHPSMYIIETRLSDGYIIIQKYFVFFQFL